MIWDAENPYKFAEVRGTVVETVTGDEARAHIDVLAQRYVEQEQSLDEIVSAGFDAHQADDMAGMKLVDADYAWVTRRLCELADRHAPGRIVSALEGGEIDVKLAPPKALGGSGDGKRADDREPQARAQAS